jgi:CheY-like chemotaxis protein
MINSVLLVDDDDTTLELLSRDLQESTGARVITSKYPTQALGLAEEYCFDFVIIDVTMEYNGTPFGGLELYKALRQRYGDSSLLSYSQFINDELLKRYHYPFNFLERHAHPKAFGAQLVEILTQTRRRHSCFLAMPFDPVYDSLFQVVEGCVQKAGYRCVRVDQQQFTTSIVNKIFDEIRKAKLIVFVATGRNANAFFEAGFAVALGKEVVTITDEVTSLPFDVRDRNALAYHGDLQQLETRLMGRLLAITQLEGL